MFLDYFALGVLLLLAVSAVGILIVLGMMPGRIASARNHQQRDAINACGWLGLLTMGILLPVAYIWAYTKTGAPATAGDDAPGADSGGAK